MMGAMMGSRQGAGGEERRPVGGSPDPNQQALDPMDFCLVRIVDADIRPGFKYQYRMRLMMENPNYGKKEMVSKPSDAAIEVIEGPWAETAEPVSVPAESGLYAVVDPNSDQAKRLKEGQALLQLQRWQMQISIDNHYKEPFGDWLVANIAVTRGMPVGSRQLVNLPLWSSEHNTFILREYAGERDKKGKATDLKKGVMMDLLRPDLLVVDVDGGRTRAYGPNRRTVDDESGYEVLLLGDDGKLRVHNSAIDLQDTSRASREETFKKWIDEVQKATQSLKSNPEGPGNRFGEQ